MIKYMRLLKTASVQHLVLINIQRLAAGGWFYLVLLNPFLTFFMSIYFLFTSYWWLVVLHLTWIYIDKNTPENGGRPSKFIQNWRWWKFLRDYYDTQLKLVPNFSLNPEKNYLFCCFPHGLAPAGPFTAIASEFNEIKQLYPNFKIRIASVDTVFYFPFSREIGLAIGGISCSAKSLTHILSQTGESNGIILFVGGSKEIQYTLPNNYRFVLKNRKGFAKIALKTGAPLIPVITFGETNQFNLLDGPIFQKCRKLVQNIFGFKLILFNGRGFFQDYFGIIPRQARLLTVVGMPIEVTKISNPSDSEIDALHATFVQELECLFETYKHQYYQNAQDIKLELI